MLLVSQWYVTTVAYVVLPAQMASFLAGRPNLANRPPFAHAELSIFIDLGGFKGCVMTIK